MDSKYGHTVNLRQYRRLDGKWQFVAVARKGNSPDPRYVIIGGEAVKSDGGTFYLDWRENGKRKTEKIGTDPKEAWTLRSGIRSGEIEDSDSPPVAEPDKGLTIDKAIENYLVEVQATKSPATHRQYKTELEWFRTICDKKYLSERAVLTP